MFETVIGFTKSIAIWVWGGINAFMGLLMNDMRFLGIPVGVYFVFFIAVGAVLNMIFKE